MNKTYALLASVVALTFTAPAFADSDETVKSNSTDAAGTTSTTEQNVKVKNHKDGSADTTIKTEATKDPKGLMNKSKVKAKEEITTDKNGAVIKDNKTVSGKVVDDSNK